MKLLLETPVWVMLIVVAEVIKWWAAAKLVAMYGGYLK